MSLPCTGPGPAPAGNYRTREFPRLRGLKGIPDSLMRSHLMLYKGYIKNVNLLHRRLKAARIGTPEWAEMKRRVGFEINGMRLHELYFENLSPGKSRISSTLKHALSAAWGSLVAWENEFAAMGRMRGIGWVVLYRDAAGGRLSNHWIGLHDQGHPVGFKPLLVMDVWEHAYRGLDRDGYVEAFLGNVDWERVGIRLSGNPCPCASMPL